MVTKVASGLLGTHRRFRVPTFGGLAVTLALRGRSMGPMVEHGGRTVQDQATLEGLSCHTSSSEASEVVSHYVVSFRKLTC